MSTYTETYCDLCNYERETGHNRACELDGNDYDTWRRAYMPEEPCMGGYWGWATFVREREGMYSKDEMHVCAGCLCDPDIDLPSPPWRPEFDEDVANVEKGRAAREEFERVRELLGTWDDRCGIWRGVRQVLSHERYYLPFKPKPVEAA